MRTFNILSVIDAWKSCDSLPQHMQIAHVLGSISRFTVIIASHLFVSVEQISGFLYTMEVLEGE